MMKKKNGFISISVIYSFFIVFLLLLTLMMSTYVNNRYVYNIYKTDIKQQISGKGDDIVDSYPTLIKKIQTEFEYGGINDTSYIYWIAQNGSEYRYQGTNPNNYINFNGKLWRIIGILNVPGTAQYLVKIISAESNPESRINVSSFNSWTDTHMSTMLTAVYNGFTSPYKELVVDTNHRYQGSFVVSKPVGLMHTDDYLYAAPSSSCTQTLSAVQSCRPYNWLGGYNEWTMVKAASGTTNKVYSINADGSVTDTVPCTSALAYRPVLYLKDNVKVSGGTGTSTNPYNIIAGS
ncbi:MAG: hypothetical protein IJO63_01500 [Bacilli bacterium]|nr:hypothetical protein [Bacilli bacterium]